MNSAKVGSNVRAALAAWLSVTRTLEPYSGLNPREARRRAGELLQLVLGGDVSPTEVELSEDFKDILSALVGLLKGFEPVDQRFSAADTVCRFIRRLKWSADDRAETNDLLLECSEFGWTALGFDIEQLVRRRMSILDATSESGNSAELSSQIEDILGSSREKRNVVRACAVLCTRGDDDPKLTLEISSTVYRRLIKDCYADVQLDEAEHLASLFALQAGTACRFLGRFSDAEGWFLTAERHAGAALTREPLLAKVAFARAALLHQRGQYSKALPLFSLCIHEFARLGMGIEYDKSQLALGMTFSALGKWRTALKILREAVKSPRVQSFASLEAHIFVHIAACLIALGEHEEAQVACSRAASLLEGRHHANAEAGLKWSIAELLRNTGRRVEALGFYRQALIEYRRFRASNLVAQLHLVIGETALDLGLDQEAEQEILAALPTIEEQNMVPEGLAALAMLKESVRRRKTDPNALRELREHLQKQK